MHRITADATHCDKIEYIMLICEEAIAAVTRSSFQEMDGILDGWQDTCEPKHA